MYIQHVKRVKKIADTIYKAKIAYYTTSNVIMTDSQYDLLEYQLAALCPNHPILDMIGYDINGDFKKLTLKETEALLNENQKAKSERSNSEISDLGSSGV